MWEEELVPSVVEGGKKMFILRSFNAEGVMAGDLIP